MGEFGNASPTWDSIHDWLLDPFISKDDHYHIRNRIAGGPTFYNIPGASLLTVWEFTTLQIPADFLYISAMAPTVKTLFQGEVRRSTNYLDLYYSRYVAPMRESLEKGGTQAGGIIAVSLLRYFLDSASWDWLQYLLDEYEDHTVEFSCYSTQWGTVPGMNTVFWEVRLY